MQRIGSMWDTETGEFLANFFVTIENDKLKYKVVFRDSDTFTTREMTRAVEVAESAFDANDLTYRFA